MTDDINMHEVAEKMLADHGPEHPRREMWEAIAETLDSARCSLCANTDWKSPYCSRCNDSTDDHDCPPLEPCAHTATYLRHKQIARAYMAAEPPEPQRVTQEQIEAATQAVLDVMDGSISRGSNSVPDWPQDEQDFHRGYDYRDFTHRHEILSRMRAEKIARAILEITHG